MSRITLIQCHFVRGLINHRLRFGTPDTILKLDKYRGLACFSAGKIFGYIRWRANEYGTQEWRFFILKSQDEGVLTSVPGIRPGVKILASFNGTQSVKRALTAFDEIEISAGGDAQSLSESFWLTFQNDVFNRKSLTGVSANSPISGMIDAR